MSRSCVVALVASLSLCASVAAQQCATQSVPLQQTNWSSSASLPRFDPSLGVLRSVEIELVASFEGDAYFENLQPGPVTISTTTVFQTDVRRPDGSVLLSASRAFAFTDAVAAFDGTIEFAGPSGFAHVGYGATSTQALQLTNGADLALFSGPAGAPGTIDLQLTCLGFGQITGGGGSYVSQTATRGGVPTLRVCYVFEAPQCATQDVAVQSTDWSTTKTFARFDPALGVLQRIELEMIARCEADLRVESFDNAPTIANSTAAFAVQVARPDASPIAVSAPSISFSDTLSAFDGVLDFDGTSGESHLGIVAADTQLASLTSPADLALFTGPAGVPGTISLQLSASATSFTTGGSALVVSFQTRAGVPALRVCYVFAPAGVAVCVGDGSTGQSCPCGNSGASGHGCANSINPLGAELEANGTPSVASDSLTLRGSGMPASATCLYFQGTSLVAAGAGAAFGDGLRCAGGTVIRLGTKTNSLGASQYPTVGDASISVRGLVPQAGGTRVYQAWYRNAGAFCTISTFNLSNGVSVSWTP